MVFTKKGIIFDYIYPKIKGNVVRSPELNKLYDFFNTIDILSFEEISRSFAQEQFKSEFELSYASDTIKQKIENYNTKYSFKLKFNNYIVSVNIFSEGKVVNDNFIYELKKYIQFTLSIHPVKTNITINYHLSDEKKMVKKGILTTNEVNSGSCMIKNDHSIINIWRKEEILKVTVHELFHALRHDNYNDNETIIEHFTSKYGIHSSKINTHEAYTEIWANLINCFLISQKYNGNNKKIFRELVTIERFYSIFQAQKVLFNSLTKKGLNIDKETNVTAYFLIRAELYQRLNAFLKFCRLQNGKYVKIENSEKWLKFLESKSKIKKNTIFKNRRSYLYKNLRMTILELDLLH
tara:strand:- start:1840 stop:2892 length:1053 start_codon:yes stop_codon:yes gene_type:complete